jgi:hypothetical protein
MNRLIECLKSGKRVVYLGYIIFSVIQGILTKVGLRSGAWGEATWAQAI